MTPQLVLTQLPTRLDNCPLYLGYYGVEDEGIITLQRDLERAYSCMDRATLTKRLIELEFRLQSNTPGRWPGECEQSYDRLVNAASDSQTPTEAILWLLRMTKGLLQISSRTDTKPMYLVIDANTSGAFLVSPRKTTTRANDRYSHNPGLERLRRQVLERLRTDI